MRGVAGDGGSKDSMYDTGMIDDSVSEVSRRCKFNLLQVGDFNAVEVETLFLFF